VSSLSDEGVTGRMKKMLQSEEMRTGMIGYIKNGVSLDYLVENYYDRSKDGKITIKPELAVQMQDMFPP
jgi:hypothetical protein